MTGEQRLDRVRPGFDWTQLRVDGETRLHAEASEYAERFRQLSRQYTDSLAVSWKATESLSPALSAVATTVRQTLGIDGELWLYPFPSSRYLVEMLPASDARVLKLAVSAPVISHLDFRATLFQIGRRVARLKHQQWPIPVDPTHKQERADRRTLFARALWRFQELTCDRVGLLCCQDLEAAASCIFKCESGLSDRWIEIDWQALDSDQHSRRDAVMRPDLSAFTTLRLRLLRAFFESTTYQNAFKPDDDQGGDVTIAEPSPVHSEAQGIDLSQSPESTEHHLVALDSPADIDQHSISAQDSVHPDDAFERRHAGFLVHATVWMMGLHSEFEPGMIEPLETLFDQEQVSQAREIWSTEGGQGLESRCRQLASEFTSAGQSDRLTLIRNLLGTLTADLPLEKRQCGELVRVAAMIEVSEDDFWVIATEYTDPEFAEYAYENGEPVEVYLDGQWIAGSVREVGASGDLRIHLLKENRSYRFHPRADLIRPASQKSAA